MPVRWIAALKEKAAGLKRLALTIYYVARDRRTPLPVRLLALLVAAYALSPIDLIPDFIPVLGYLDDLVLIPLGVALVVKLTPPDIVAEARERARASGRRPVSYGAAAVIILFWIAILALITRWLVGLFSS